MRQEVVSNEEAQEYEIINETLKVKSERQLKVLKFQEKVFTNNCDLYELELN